MQLWDVRPRADGRAASHSQRNRIAVIEIIRAPTSMMVSAVGGYVRDEDAAVPRSNHWPYESVAPGMS
jgi:hypothetical protein